jgi:hypothetical protein
MFSIYFTREKLKFRANTTGHLGSLVEGWVPEKAAFIGRILFLQCLPKFEKQNDQNNNCLQSHWHNLHFIIDYKR